MTILTSLLITAFMAATAFAADRPVRLEDEVLLDIPYDWIVTDTPGYPLRIVNDPPSAEMLLFRSEIVPDELVVSGEDLRLSVDAVIEEIILPLPDAKLLTNTGTFDERSAGFIIEFTSTDTELNMTLRHRFNGRIFGHPDGHQLLFTLWARGTFDEWPSIESTFVAMQESFDYVGPSTATVFSGAHSDMRPYYFGGAMLVVLVMIVLLGRRQMRLNRVTFSDDPRVWRCACGRLNHSEVTSCRRCGRSQQAERVGH